MTDTKRIFKIAIPIIIHQLSLQMQLWVDRAMLGHVNPEYFSAIGNVLFPYSAVLSIITSICTGTTILIALNIGAKKLDLAQKYAECSFFGNSLIPVLAFLFFFFASPVMFTIMGVQSPIYEYAIDYIKILSFNMLILGVATTAVSVMQGIGITKLIMVAGIVGNVLNIFLDWVLIYGKLGFPQMNIQGAALATTISNFIAAPILLINVFKSKKIPFFIRIKNIFKFDWKLYKHVFKVGFPTGAEFALWNTSNLVVVFFLNKLNMMYTGIYSLMFSIENVAFLIYIGFARATLTLVGQKTGENEHKQAIAICFKCLRISLLVCLVVAGVFWIFPRSVLGLFTSDASLINFAVPFLLIVAVKAFPKCINIVIGHGIRGTGDTKWMFYSQILGTVFVITVSYLLMFTFKLGLLGIFLTVLFDEAFRSVINFVRFWKGREAFNWFFRLFKPKSKILTQ